MDYRVGAVERAAFKRCRRQWDLGSANRQQLRPVAATGSGLADAVREALAVYYYPGMWDWQSSIVLPLVRKAFMRSIAAAPASAQRTEDVDVGTELLERYFEWAPSVDDFGPLKIEQDVEAIVPDIRRPDTGLLTGAGRRVLYTERVPLLAVDDADEFWVVRHQVVAGWGELETLLLDEAAIAACWAWEETFLGMQVTGTIHNEVLRSPPAGLEPAPRANRTGRPGRGGYAQHEPSGGGRSIPQHQRPDRVADRPMGLDRVRQETAGVLRRTHIRRTRAEIAAAGVQIGAEVLDMLDPELRVYPTPSAAHCGRCDFLAPCLTMGEGADPALDLAARYRRDPVGPAHTPRLGAGGGGRGAVMPPAPPL
ncbi:hypothetical protein BH20ACT5_BH20ACT5_15850 [soil metagenome]